MKIVIAWILIGCGIAFVFAGSAGAWLLAAFMILTGLAMLKGKVPLLFGSIIAIIGFFIYKNHKDVAAFKAGKGVVNTPTIIFDSPNLAQIINITQISPDKWNFSYMNFTASERGLESTSEFKTGATGGSVTNYNTGNDVESIRYRIFWK